MQTLLKRSTEAHLGSFVKDTNPFFVRALGCELADEHETIEQNGGFGTVSNLVALTFLRKNARIYISSAMLGIALALLRRPCMIVELTPNSGVGVFISLVWLTRLLVVINNLKPKAQTSCQRSKNYLLSMFFNNSKKYVSHCCIQYRQLF